jgi:hypothetical protein
MIAVFNTDGVPTPLKFKVIEEDENKIINVDKVLKAQKSNYGCSESMIFTCETVIEDTKKVYLIRYELKTMKWDLPVPAACGHVL